jgi:hypothetical protein
VPCCEACRKHQSKDDEYFKFTLVMRRDVVHEPYVQAVVDSVYRGLGRPEGKGFANSLRRSARSIPKQTVSGSYDGVETVYRLDSARLTAVMRRTLLGLYFHETGQRLPDTHCALVYRLWDFRDEPEMQAHFAKLLQTIMTGTIREIGSGVFAYAFKISPHVPHYTLWLFTVYRRVVFYGQTCKLEDFPSITGGQNAD